MITSLGAHTHTVLRSCARGRVCLEDSFHYYSTVLSASRYSLLALGDRATPARLSRGGSSIGLGKLSRHKSRAHKSCYLLPASSLDEEGVASGVAAGSNLGRPSRNAPGHTGRPRPIASIRLQASAWVAVTILSMGGEFELFVLGWE